jgi:ribonuclease HI
MLKYTWLRGVASAGGIIFDPEGIHETSFEWGLGEVTNNQAEAFAFFQGLKIFDSRRIRNL